MDKVRIGIVGLGNMGSLHVTSVGNVSDAVLSAVCDCDEAKARKFADQAGCRAFTDAITMFKSGSVDAVIIAVPHYDHTPLTIAAFEHGLHVLTEKPIAVHVKDARKMIEAHARHPELVFAAMFQQRTLKAHCKIKQMIDRGELGEIYRVSWIITDWFRTQRYYDTGGWRATWKGEGGGVLLNQCPHQLDLFQWFFGLPSQVRAFVKIGRYHHIEVEDEVTACCEFSNGASATFITTTGEFPGSNRLEIAGTRGKLVFESGKLVFTRTEQTVDEFCAVSDQAFGSIPVWNIDVPYGTDSGTPHQDVIANFVAAISSGAALIAPADEGIKSVELGNAMLYSGLNNQTLKLPLDGDAYESMLNRLINSSKFEKNTTTDAVVNMSGSF